MAIDILVTITGEKQGQFKGPIQDQALQGKGAMRLQSFTFGFSNPRTIGSAAGGGSPGGGPTASEVVMTRAVEDVVTAQLQQALLTSEVLTSVQVFFRRAPGQPYMTLTLSHAFITAIHMLSDSGSDAPLEEIHLIFEQTKLEIHNTDPKTGEVIAGSPATVSYDLTKATPG